MNRLRGASRGAFFNQLERLFGEGTSVGLSEGELLERFVTGHDEVAFEALVARHGPMVLGVCRQFLRDPNDVDDAFQATFLVLVRKAGTLRRRDLLGNWLYGVANRVAARARTLSARRNSRVTSGQDSVESLTNQECGPDVGRDQAMHLEQGPWLHQEVSHLPEKYRIPIVLCYFEGLTHDEAALRLGWPLGTVKGRLARARDLLRRRLTRRGVTLSAAALGSHLAVIEAKAAVPASLRLTTLQAAHALACEVGASLARSSAVSLPVSALVEGVLHTMIANQVKSVVLSSLLVIGTVATGVVVGASQLSGGSANARKANQVPASSTDSAAIRKAAVPRSEGTTPSVSPQLAQQLSAEHTSFGQLLTTFREPEIQDIDRLSRWSLITLEADQVLGTTEADRVAAYEAHRDRMKRLHDFTQKIPVSDKNQPVKADHAQNILQQAEQWLEASRQGEMPGMMAAMGGMMGGGRRGQMGVMGGIGRTGMMSGSGQIGMMGSGVGRTGMMAEMMRKESNPSNVAAEPLPGQIAAKDAPKQEANAAAQGAAAQKTSDEPTQEQQKGAARKAGQNRAVAGMSGMGGGMSGMGGGMSGMGGGMGGMGGGMGGGMMGGLSPEAVTRGLRWSNAALAAQVASRDTEPKSKATLKKLEEPIRMSFASDTALEAVLKYIKQATATKHSNSIPIYVDPKGLKDAEATLQSAIRLDLEGVPLKTTLRLMLKQIGLAYCVRDGVLIISSVQGINEELREALNESDGNDSPEAAAGGFGGSAGRNMGGMM
jgi:RNA polymerase sigma factor (sigma-70 family)